MCRSKRYNESSMNESYLGVPPSAPHQKLAGSMALSIATTRLDTSFNLVCAEPFSRTVQTCMTKKSGSSMGKN